MKADNKEPLFIDLQMRRENICANMGKVQYQYDGYYSPYDAIEDAFENTHLLSASKDMFFALQDIIKAYDRGENISIEILTAKEAIRKANPQQ